MESCVGRDTWKGGFPGHGEFLKEGCVEKKVFMEGFVGREPRK